MSAGYYILSAELSEQLSELSEQLSAVTVDPHAFYSDLFSQLKPNFDEHWSNLR